MFNSGIIASSHRDIPILPIIQEYQDILDEIVLRGFSTPSEPQQIKLNSFYTEIVGNGLYAKANTIGMFTNSDSDAVRIDGANVSNLYPAINSPLHDPITGFEFDGAMNYLTTGTFGLSGTTFAANHGASINQSGIDSIIAGTTSLLYGYREFGPTNEFLFGYNASKVMTFSIQQGVAATFGATIDDDKNYYITRDGTTNISVFEDGILLDSQSMAILPVAGSGTIGIGCALNGGTNPIFYAEAKVKHLIYAEDMDADVALWETALSNYYAL